MNAPAFSAPHLISELRSFVGLCEELLSLSTTEHHALNGPARFESAPFAETRKNLLTRLNEVLVSVKNSRRIWQQQSATERAQHPEVKALLEVLQQMILKILQLDRENQQSLLRAGMLPARHLPAAATQQPGFVSRLYSRHALS